MRVITLGFILLLCACGGDPAARQAAEAARLLAADRAIAAESLLHGSAAAYYAGMGEDALELPANAPPLQGRAKIRERLDALGAQALDWTPQRAEVSRGLDLGWTWGEWRLLRSAASGEVVARGKYLKVWHRGADGAWKLAADIANQAQQETPPAPPAQP